VIEGLTYFVELRGSELLRLVERPGLLDALARGRAAVAVAMLDLSAERRDALRELAGRGLRLCAWLTLAEEEGYWLGVDNAERALARYREVSDWLRAAGLEVEAVGLDLEPPLEDSRALVEEGGRELLRLLRRRRGRQAVERARRLYGELCDQIRADGRRAETYQFPFIIDERRAGSSLLHRTLGLVDVPADREVLMLYESLLPEPLGQLLVESYGPECEAIGVGLSGGGVPFVLHHPAIGARCLEGARLLEAVRRARRYTEHLYVFSLEGCVQSGSLDLLLEADAAPPPPLHPLAPVVRAARAGLQLLLRLERLGV
jgi:hypothetical protein